MFFFADDGKHGLEFWKTDGTSAGTALVKDIYPGPHGLDLSRGTEAMTAVGTTVYFAADDDAHGCELWRSDGTAAGTVMVADMVPGEGSSYPRFMSATRGGLLYAATDPRHGYALWRVDAAAHAQRLGYGCAVGRPPVLQAGVPALGTTLPFDVTTGTAKSQSGVLVLGVAPARPTYLGSGCTVYLDLGKHYLPLLFKTDRTGRWHLNINIPNQPALSGLLIPAQAAVGSTRNPPIGVDLSAGLLLSVR